MENQVKPYWAAIEKGQQNLTSPKWAPTAQLQHLVNTLGDSTTEIFNRAHTIALETCPTKKTTPSTQHHQRRQTSRLRTKYLRLRSHLKTPHHSTSSTPPPHTHSLDETLQQLAKQANPPPCPNARFPPTPPIHSTPQPMATTPQDPSGPTYQRTPPGPRQKGRQLCRTTTHQDAYVDWQTPTKK
jgi:hypothetical protein